MLGFCLVAFVQAPTQPENVSSGTSSLKAAATSARKANERKKKVKQEDPFMDNLNTAINDLKEEGDALRECAERGNFTPVDTEMKNAAPYEKKRTVTDRQEEEAEAAREAARTRGKADGVHGPSLEDDEDPFGNMSDFGEMSDSST